MSLTRALLLVGHGSSQDPGWGATLRRHAERIRRGRVFDNVQTAFWREDPPIHGALARIQADHVYVVPMLLADGYFARRVVPRALGVRRGANARGVGLVHYCPPVGTHPSMRRLVLCRANAAARLPAARRRRAALILIGHGTDREPRSGDLVHAIAGRLAATSGYGRVAAAFLDQEPRLARVVGEVRAADVVLVPFFASDGVHTRGTIPDVLGLRGQRTVLDGRVLWYAKPDGTCAELAHVVVDVALRASSFPGRGVPTRRSGT
jgi:sirohydrochlorin cobaltochelatase